MKNCSTNLFGKENNCLGNLCFCLYDKNNFVHTEKLLKFINQNKIYRYGSTLINETNFKIMMEFDIESNEIRCIVIYRLCLSKSKIKYLSIEGYIINPIHQGDGLLTNILYVIFSHEINNGIQRIYLHSISNFYDFILVDIFNFKKLDDEEFNLIENIFYDTYEHHDIVVEVDNPNFVKSLSSIRNNLENKNLQKDIQNGGSMYYSKYKKYKIKYLKYKSNVS